MRKGCKRTKTARSKKPAPVIAKPAAMKKTKKKTKKKAKAKSRR